MVSSQVEHEEEAMSVSGYEKRPPRVIKGARALKKALIIARRNGLTRSDVRSIYDQVESEQDASMRHDLLLYNFRGIDRNEQWTEKLIRLLKAVFT